MRALILLCAAVLGCSQCRIDGDCGQGRVCSRLGNGCLTVLLQQTPVESLDGWTFSALDGGIPEHGFDGGVEIWTSPGAAGEHGRVTASHDFDPSRGGPVELGLYFRPEFIATAAGPAAWIGFRGSSAQDYFSDQAFAGDLDYRLLVRFGDGRLYWELRRAADDLLVRLTTIPGLSDTGLTGPFSSFEFFVSVRDASAGSARMLVRSLTVAEQR